ncbi:hypothetical protein RBSWK_01162 [Rhodopirellula baltica SWK14]|uniref:Uncharacterized protein n=1 Tax=Rhodopirellula baltica SWK14 TaxID=993516 RepID=L7CKR3_RHOBT|nr:hypothetical protein RBSWK_01162 [Rhodopirellula baltica SWK14]
MTVSIAPRLVFSDAKQVGSSLLATEPFLKTSRFRRKTGTKP